MMQNLEITVRGMFSGTISQLTAHISHILPLLYGAVLITLHIYYWMASVSDIRCLWPCGTHWSVVGDEIHSQSIN